MSCVKLLRWPVRDFVVIYPCISAPKDSIAVMTTGVMLREWGKELS